MNKYLVNYMIPSEGKSRAKRLTTALQKIIEESFPEIAEQIIEERSEDYDAIYKKLDKIGVKILTSCYLVRFEGNATQLVTHLLEDLDDDLRKRIRFLVTEFPENRSFIGIGNNNMLIEIGRNLRFYGHFFCEDGIN